MTRRRRGRTGSQTRRLTALANPGRCRSAGLDWSGVGCTVLSASRHAAGDAFSVAFSVQRSAFSVQRSAFTAAFYGREGEGGLVLLLERPRTPTIGWTARARRASVPLRTHGSPRVIVAGWVIDFCSRAPPAGIIGISTSNRQRPVALLLLLHQPHHHHAGTPTARAVVNRRRNLRTAHRQSQRPARIISAAPMTGRLRRGAGG